MAERARRLGAVVEPADLAGRRVLVAGLGRSGRSAARHLAAFGARVVAADDDPRTDTSELEALGVRTVLGQGMAEALDGAKLVVVAPGVPESHELLQAAGRSRIPVWSEIELAGRLARMPLVGVTGTNGKTTTTELAAAMLAAGGTAAVAAGNVGLPLLDAVLASPAPQAVVVELSSFQLRFTETLRLRAAAWLNLAPDHLDWHGTLERYTAAKARVWANQEASDWVVYPVDDPVVAAHAAAAAGTPVPFSPFRPVPGGLGIDAGVAVSRVPGLESGLWRAGALALPGRHNLANGLAASALAMALGTPPVALARAVAAFAPRRHRLEPAGEVREVRFVNDSKATNPHAAERALDAFPRVVWIAGGRNKGLAFDELARAAIRGVVAAVVMGESADDIEGALRGAGFRGPVSRAATMSEAVTIGFSVAEPGDTVLLAPACASQDMYSDYAERGDAFTAAVTRLAERTGGSRRRVAAASSGARPLPGARIGGGGRTGGP